MILYKYYGYKTGLMALKNKQLGFRFPEYFNDPFELSYLMLEENNTNSKSRTINSQLQNLRESVAILSLTESPLNPLMWAHYGESHSGFVIGYDVDNRFLNSNEYCLIPASEGRCEYSEGKPKKVLSDSERDTLFKWFQLGLGLPDVEIEDPSRIYKKIFLTKSSHWSYEKEIRIVKSVVDMTMEHFEYLKDPLRKHYSPCIEMPDGRLTCQPEGLLIFEQEVQIKEIYFGANNPGASDRTEDLEVIEDLLGVAPVDLYVCQPNKETWSFSALKHPLI